MLHLLFVDFVISPHLTVKTAEEAAVQQQRMSSYAASGSNSTPLLAVDERQRSSAKRLSSPERFEIKQLIASGAVSAADVSIPTVRENNGLMGLQYPDLDEDFSTNVANHEIEEDIDVEVNEVEPAFLSGQTKVTLELSPVKIIKAPDG